MAAVAFLIPNALAKHNKDVQKIPFKLYRNHLVVSTGRLGHIENRNLLIDTGANPTVVDEALAYELGLKPVDRPPGGMRIVGGVAQTYYAILDSLDLGPIHREAMQVAVANLSLIQAQVGIRIDAIIGLDAIEPNNFQIDYESRKISFGAIRLSSAAVPMAQISPFVIVETEVNGAVVNLIVDTGASDFVLFRDVLPESLSTLPAGSKIQLSNVAGDLLVPQIQLANFRVGNTDLSGSTALLTTVPNCCEFQGMLGISGLRFRRIIFDFQHRLVELDLPARYEAMSSLSGFCSRAVADAGCGHALLPGLMPR
jgi:predicted aspartyl protease